MTASICGGTTVIGWIECKRQTASCLRICHKHWISKGDSHAISQALCMCLHRIWISISTETERNTVHWNLIRSSSSAFVWIKSEDHFAWRGIRRNSVWLQELTTLNHRLTQLPFEYLSTTFLRTPRLWPILYDSVHSVILLGTWKLFPRIRSLIWLHCRS